MVVLVLHAYRLPLGRAASIGEAGQVLGEHEEVESDDLGELVRESQHVCLGRPLTKV